MNTNFQKRKNYFPRFVKNPFRDESQSLVYNSFRISTGRPPAYNELAIQYGNHRERISQQYSDWQHTIDKLWEGACEYITHNGQTTILTYLSSPDGLYALHRILPDGSENIHYLHTDHTSTTLSTGLGSWTAVTDETGSISDEQSFDAWGNRRDPETWRAYTSTPASPLFDRGFTGHVQQPFGLLVEANQLRIPIPLRNESGKHLDGFQLINPDTFHCVIGISDC